MVYVLRKKTLDCIVTVIFFQIDKPFVRRCERGVDAVLKMDAKNKECRNT